MSVIHRYTFPLMQLPVIARCYWVKMQGTIAYHPHRCDITNSSSYSGQSFRKKSMLKKFRANVLKSALVLRSPTCQMQLTTMAHSKKRTNLRVHYSSFLKNNYYMWLNTI